MKNKKQLALQDVSKATPIPVTGCRPIVCPPVEIARLVGLLLLCLVVVSGNAQACSRNINDLKPKAKQKFIQLKKEALRHGIRIEAICTYRSAREQLELFKRGRSTRGPKVTWRKHSRHSDGTAFDIAIYHGSKISWNPHLYEAVGNIAKTIGGLEWGGNWKVKDLGHFQLKEVI